MMDSAGETPLDEEKASAAAEALQSFLGTDHLVQAVEALDAPTPAPTCADPVWDQLNGVLNAPTCRKCMMPCALDKLVNKSKGEQRVHVVCRSCNSTTTMLSRHLGQWPIAGFQGLSPDQQVAFWKQCHSIIQRQGRLDYGSIRAFLAVSLAEKQYEIASAEFKSKYLPLSVWTAKGYKEEDVKKGLKETHPILGDTYAVPLKTVTKGFYREKVEEMITKFEAEARKKKGAKIEVLTPAGSAPAAASAPAAGSAPEPRIDEVQDDEDLQPLTWLQEKSPCKKRSAAEMEETKPEETPPPQEPSAKAQRQAAAALRRHNVNVQKMAQKGLDVLNPLLGSMVKHQANFPILPAKTVDEIKAVGDQIEKLVMKCRDGLKLPETGERLDELAFDSKSLAQKIKEFKAVFNNADRLLKLINKANGK